MIVESEPFCGGRRLKTRYLAGKDAKGDWQQVAIHSDGEIDVSHPVMADFLATVQPVEQDRLKP